MIGDLDYDSIPQLKRRRFDDSIHRSCRVDVGCNLRCIVRNSTKVPELAGCLSCIFPGLGQFCNGQPEKGCLQFGMVSVGGAFALLVASASVYDSFGGGSSGSSEAVAYAGLAVAAFGWLWSVIDASESAYKANEQDDTQQHGQLMQFNDVGMGSIGGQNVLEAKVILRF